MEPSTTTVSRAIYLNPALRTRKKGGFFGRPPSLNRSVGVETGATSGRTDRSTRLLRLPVRVTRSRRSVHPAHATAAGHRGHLLLLLLLHHHALSGEEQSRDGRGVLQRRAGDLGWVDHASQHQVLVLVGLGVVAEVQLGGLLHL